eukprot:TRINITY_DN62911_c0_g1_i1.p1 TRINITY_DN62911_c0_g1~~TRINITY_DN62911_c0_g1_i1.p1  ORF type:complete len:569 (-),score=85.68 TRINITY_DN62911_c0_g1_i1:107-1813(-)
MATSRNCRGRQRTRDSPMSSESMLSIPAKASTISKRAPLLATTRSSLPLIGVFLGDVEYFVVDVLNKSLSDGLAWLFAVAWEYDSSSPVDGSEWPDGSVDPPLPCFLECPFALVCEAGSDAEQASILERLKILEDLQFHCGGVIKVFGFKGPKPWAEWSFVFTHVIPQFTQQLREAEPQWFCKPDQLVGRVPRPLGSDTLALVPVHRVALVPSFFARDELFFFLVKSPEALGHGVWTTVGGKARQGGQGDSSFFGTAMREWSEEVLAFSPQVALNTSASDGVFPWVVWKANSREWVSWSNVLSPGGSCNEDGVSSMAWLFVEAMPEFFTETFGHESDLAPADADVVRKTDTRDRFRLVHTKGVPFIEQEKGAWFRLDMCSGKLFTYFEGAQVRGDFGFSVLQSKDLRDQLALLGYPNHELPVGGRCNHEVAVSPEGLRNKFEVLKFNTANLSPEASTKELVAIIGRGLLSDEYHQFYSEEVEAFLARGADPTAAEGLPAAAPSLLGAVLLNWHLHDNVALRSAEFLCRALARRGHELTREEGELLHNRLVASNKDLQSRWRRLQRNRP